MARLDIEEYQSKWEDMTEGQQISVDHSACPAGTDTRQRLYLKKTAGKILGYCHHCGNSAVVSTKGKGSYKSVNKLLEMDKEIKAEKGKRTLPLDAKHVFNLGTLAHWTHREQDTWFNSLGGKGRDGISDKEAASMILVYLYRCGLLLPGNLSLPPLPYIALEPRGHNTYQETLTKTNEYHRIDHSAMRFLSHNPLMKRFWQELKFSPSQVRLFIPYWNNSLMNHEGLGGMAECEKPPSGYMGRDVMIDAPVGSKRIKWLKYPLTDGAAANTYTWQHIRPGKPAHQNWMQIYVEDLISQLRIVQALYRSFPTGSAIHTPSARGNFTFPSMSDNGMAQYNILSELDGIRIICCQGTSLNPDVQAAAQVPYHNLYKLSQTERRFGAAWMDLDTAGRSAALKLAMLPLPGTCSSSMIVIADEPKNGTDLAIISEIADLLPSRKGWV